MGERSELVWEKESEVPRRSIGHLLAGLFDTGEQEHAIHKKIDTLPLDPRELISQPLHGDQPFTLPQISDFIRMRRLTKKQTAGKLKEWKDKFQRGEIKDSTQKGSSSSSGVRASGARRPPTPEEMKEGVPPRGSHPHIASGPTGFGGCRHR